MPKHYWVVMVSWLAACAASGLVGFKIAHDERYGGQMLVPTKKSSIYRLPRWACAEIVDLRQQKLQLFKEMVRAYDGDKAKPLILFHVGDLSECRK